jgi:D-3-phosphoglycerate dehydrogenase / 2-oxoglutarate reductase
MSGRLVVLDAGFGDVSLEAAAAAPYGVAVSEAVAGTDFLDAGRDAEGVLVRYGSIPASLIERSNWRVIGRYGVGVDNVDVEAASKHGVAVINVPDYCVEEVASHAAALILSGWRKLDRSRRLIEQHRWDDWSSLQPIRPLSECSLGLVGVGRIGAEVVRLCSAFFGRIVAFDPAGTPPGVEQVDLDGLFATADVVSLHCPLNAATANIVDGNRLASMKADALLVNVSRGGLVDPVALARALRAGRPGGAALDVLPSEPPDPDDPLLDAPNMILTNHVAWLSDASIGRLRSLVAARCAAFLAGERVETVVNAVALRELAAT